MFLMQGISGCLCWVSQWWDSDPHNEFQANYPRIKFAALLWKSDNEKANGGYISKKDNPSKPKVHFTPLAEDDFC